ncbi:MAG: hypothetical protein AYL28_005780 [Candidatus Bathyarchaeota archaeon B23]|nr:MAG: hypothetical protein AYL28_005780 [Candidatus Bathyarchaeota archaeon B23]
MGMRATIPYGEREVSFEIPEGNLAWIIDRGSKKPYEDVSSRLREALRRPTASRPLRELASNARRVVILVDDYTRPTPQRVLLPTILDELNEAGVKDRQVEIIVALGTHRVMRENEMKAKFGGEILDRVEVRNFDCHDEAELIDIGRTPTGIEVVVSRRVYEADLVIGVGNIVPHCYAGWAGGGKIVQPGVCGVKTIEETHIASGMTRPIFKIAGDLENPVRRMIDEVALKSGLRFIVNTILNERDEVCGLAVGHPLEAFKRGVEEARELYCQEIPRLADIVVASSYPADIDYWQALKPTDYACLGVREGGIVILVSPCPEGISPVHGEVRERGRLSYDEVLEAYRRGDIEDGVAAAALMIHTQIREHAGVICVSDGLSEEDKEALGFEHAETVEEALQRALREMGERAGVGVMRCGDILPTIKS